MKKILAVDDSASIRQMVSFTLRVPAMTSSTPSTAKTASPKPARRSST
jgi:hypothetical protein